MTSAELLEEYNRVYDTVIDALETINPTPCALSIALPTLEIAAATYLDGGISEEHFIEQARETYRALLSGRSQN